MDCRVLFVFQANNTKNTNIILKLCPIYASPSLRREAPPPQRKEKNTSKVGKLSLSKTATDY